MAAIGKQVPEKYRSSIFDAPAEINQRRSSTGSAGGSINPITGEPLFNAKSDSSEDVSDAVSVSSNSSSSGAVEPSMSPKMQPQQQQQQQPEAVPAGMATQQQKTPGRRVPPGGFSTLHLG